MRDFFRQIPSTLKIHTRPDILMITLYSNPKFLCWKIFSLNPNTWKIHTTPSEELWSSIGMIRVVPAGDWTRKSSELQEIDWKKHDGEKCFVKKYHHRTFILTWHILIRYHLCEYFRIFKIIAHNVKQASHLQKLTPRIFPALAFLVEILIFWIHYFAKQSSLFVLECSFVAFAPNFGQHSRGESSAIIGNPFSQQSG